MSFGENAYTYQLEGRSYLNYQGVLYPIGVAPSGQRYVTKNGMLYPLPNTPSGVMAGGMIFPHGTGAPPVIPAGQVVTGPQGQTFGTYAASPPAVAAGTDANGYYVDGIYNVLDANGNVVGAPGTRPTNGMLSVDAVPPGMASNLVVPLGGGTPMTLNPSGVIPTVSGPSSTVSAPTTTVMNPTAGSPSTMTVAVRPAPSLLVVGGVIVAVLGGLFFLVGRTTAPKSQLRSARARSSRD